MNLLVVLDALFELRSVTNAGKRLNLSQSATSSALSRLRSYFNDDLLVAKRSSVGTKEMIATAFGKSLEGPVRLVLAELRATLSRPSVFDIATCTEHIRIIAPDFIEILLLAEVARRASELAPMMTFEISGGGTNDETITELDRSIADFVIATPQHLAPGHPSKPLLDDTSVCLGCATNSSVRHPLSQEEFLSLKRIELNKVHSDRTLQVDEMKLSLLRSESPRIKIDNLCNIPSYILASDLVCIVPQKLALHFMTLWPLRFTTIETLDQPIEFHLQWNRSFTGDPARAWFRDFLIRSAQEIARNLQAKINPELLNEI